MAVTRRGFLKAGLATLAPDSARRPNVLFLSIDDMNDWVGFLGYHPQAVTPNMDRLARRGVRFTRAYCQAPMCNPSRASLLTGLRPNTTAIYTNEDVWRDGAKGVVTLPEAYMQAGYRVQAFGKIHHTAQPDFSCWHDYMEHPERQPPKEVPGNGITDIKIDWGITAAPEAEDADPTVAAKAADFLARKHDRPFFLGCGLRGTHLPWYVPSRYAERFPAAGVSLPPYLANDLDDVPRSAIRQEALEEHRIITGAGKWRDAVAAYLSCLSYVDANVGRVMEALGAGPHANDTIVVLWADHGWHLGEKNHWHKYTLWERSCHVALTIATPGGRTGLECRRAVELLDVYPTLAELCELPANHRLQGRSLLPLLHNPKAEWDEAAITSNGADRISVRTGRWRYSRYSDGEELYDLAKDPNEWTNLAGQPKHEAVLEQLAARLPKTVNRRKLRQFKQLTEQEREQIRGKRRG